MFAIPQANKRRKRLLLTLSWLSAILVAIGGVLYWHSRESLLEFVNQDLRKLDDSQQTGLRKLLTEYLPDAFPGPRTRLNKVLKRVLPEEFRPSDHPWGWETWYVWRLENETDSRCVVFQTTSYHLFGEEWMAIHFLNANGTYESHSVISMDWNDIKDAAVLHHELLDGPVIEITVSPLIGVNALGSLFGPPNRQIYALFENRIALLRIENSKGNLVNSRSKFKDLRVLPVIRTAEEWENLLLSSDRRQILEALNWIGENHRSGPNEDHVRDDAVKDGRLAEAVRERPAVQRRIAELTQSEYRWVREAAVVAQESLPK